MKIVALRSDAVYRKMAAAPAEKREDIYRYELMKPFEKKWACYHIPLKAPRENGYDVVMASRMAGILPPVQVDETQSENIRQISSDEFWESCQASLERYLRCFTGAGIDLPVQDYLFTVLLANPESLYTKMNECYCGDGGIPGYILGSLVPSAATLWRLPVALAHEANHNVRFQFEKWRQDITLGEMMVSEGLAENLAVSLFGEDQVGSWVSKTDRDTLNNTIKPIIKGSLDKTGFDTITAYLYGDEMAKMQHYFPVGLPYCAGYACGYYLVKHYLKKTGRTIVEATLLPAAEIIKESEDFWDS